MHGPMPTVSLPLSASFHSFKMEIVTLNSEADICNLAQCLAHCHGWHKVAMLAGILLFPWERRLEEAESGVKGALAHPPPSACLGLC